MDSFVTSLILMGLFWIFIHIWWCYLWVFFKSSLSYVEGCFLQFYSIIKDFYRKAMLNFVKDLLHLLRWLCDLFKFTYIVYYINGFYMLSQPCICSIMTTLLDMKQYLLISWSHFLWIFFQTLHSNMVPVLESKYISYKQQKVGSCFLIHSINMCLLIGELKPFFSYYWKVYVDRCHFVPFLLFVFLVLFCLQLL